MALSSILLFCTPIAAIAAIAAIVARLVTLGEMIPDSEDRP